MKLKFDFLRKVALLLIGVAFLNFAHAQRTITGTVMDEDGSEPLIGATVVVKGTSKGTITDFDGKYSLEVPADATALEFSYTGYANQTIELGASNTVDVTMSAGTVLDEVVVVGYGAVKKSDLTGAVATLKADDFNQGIVVGADQLIQGKVAGVQMINNSGQPGGATTVRIRGNSSIRAGQDPLYVVDGIPLDGRSARPDFNSATGNTPGANPLNFINPFDIASIDILKDASAAAIYGSRAANGVVLITTKKGKAGENSIDFNANTGFSNILQKYDVLNASEYRATASDYGITFDDQGADVDAFDEILQSGVYQNYNVGFTGGTEKNKFRISAGLQDVEGIVKETGIRKYTGLLNGNLNYFDNDRLRIDYMLVLGHTTEELAPISTNAGFTGNLVGQALQWNPTTPLRNADGSLNVLKGSTTVNPVAYNAAYDDEARVTTIIGSISPSFKITDNLTYKMLYSVNQSSGSRRSQTRSFINIQGVEDVGVAFIANAKLTTQQFTHTLTYAQDITDNLSLNILGGYEYQKFDFGGDFAAGQDFPFDVIDYYNYLQGSDESTRNIGSFTQPISELQSFFGRVNATVADNLLLTATVRADGSTKFGENNKYGVFPSFAAAYNFTEFMPDEFDQLKLRAGYGVTGNQEFPAGASLRRFAVINGGGTEQTNAQNPNLQWETSTTIGVGVDFALFDYKLSGSIDFFERKTSDLLFFSPLSPPAPDIGIWRNLDGEVVNTGLELGLNYFVISNEDMDWNIGFNATFLNNELQNYDGPPINTGQLFGQGITGATSQRFENGQPLGAYYLRNHTGLNDAGQSEFRDNEALFFNGDPNPNAIIGFFSTFRYGKFDVNVAFNGAYGHQIYNNTKNTVIPIGNLGTRNIDANLVGNNIQEATSNAVKASDRYLEDGDYLKLTNATIGYNLGNIGVFKSARIYATGQNLLIFTDYSGFDPEVNTVNFNENGVPSLGIEYIPYPTSRTFIFGISFSL